MGLTVLGVRSFVTDDSRYGFGMFSHKVHYLIDYEWVFPYGLRLPHTLGKDVRGKARSPLRSGRWLSSYYATGAVLSWVRGYADHAVVEHKPDGATAFRVGVLHHQYNDNTFTYTTYRVPIEPDAQ